MTIARPNRLVRALLSLLAVCALLAVLVPSVRAQAGSRHHLTYDTSLSKTDGAGEPEIAVNPRDPSNLVAALMHGVVVSHDGGRTWKQTSPGWGGDPTVVADRHGRFYVSYIALNDGIRVHVSDDGGRTWKAAGDPLNGPDGPVAPGAMRFDPRNGPVQMGPWAIVACDREFLASDPSTGTLYASCADHGDASGGESGQTWEAGFLACRANGFSSSIETNCGRRYVSFSRDHGRTWSRFYPEDSARYPAGYTGAFAGIPVAAHGVLATAYVAGRAGRSQCSPCAVFETSTNHGRTWRRHVVPGATPQIYAATTTDPVGGPNSVGGHIGNDFQSVWFEPYVAADPSTPGRYAIMILDDTRTELLVYVTNDSGRTWKGPAALGRGEVGFRDKPAMAYGPGGALGVTWKSVQPEHAYRFNVRAAVSPHGGTQFGHPIRLNRRTSAQQPCGLGMQGQAYTCDELSWMVMDRRHLHTVWAGAPGGKEAPWYGRYDFAADPQFR